MYKALFSFLFPVMLPVLASAQRESRLPPGSSTRKGVIDTTKYLHVQVVPEFNGRIDTFLANHITFPPAAIKRIGCDTTGYLSNRSTFKVMVKFVVCEDGSTCDYEVIKGFPELPELGAEVISAIRQMPPWKPGMQDGEKVKVYYTLPVTFSLD